MAWDVLVWSGKCGLLLLNCTWHSILSTYLELLSSPSLIWIGLAWNLKERQEKAPTFPLLYIMLSTETQWEQWDRHSYFHWQGQNSEVWRSEPTTKPGPMVRSDGTRKRQKAKRSHVVPSEERRMRGKCCGSNPCSGAFMQNLFPHLQKQGNKIYFQDWL